MSKGGIRNANFDPPPTTSIMFFDYSSMKTAKEGKETGK